MAPVLNFAPALNNYERCLSLIKWQAWAFSLSPRDSDCVLQCALRNRRLSSLSTLHFLLFKILSFTSEKDLVLCQCVPVTLMLVVYLIIMASLKSRSSLLR